MTQMKMRRNWLKSTEITVYFPKANITNIRNTIFTVCDPWGKSGTMTNPSVVTDLRSSGVARFQVKRRNGSETWLYFLICLRGCQANKRARLGSALDYHCGPRQSMRRGWKAMLRFTCSCWTGDICTTRASRVAPFWTKVFSPVRLRKMR